MSAVKLTKFNWTFIDPYNTLQYNKSKYIAYKGGSLMTKKITAIFLALCMAISVLPMTIQAASKPDIKVGDYVKMGAYNNASILWRCVSIDNNGPLMLADKIVETRHGKTRGAVAFQQFKITQQKL